MAEFIHSEFDCIDKITLTAGNVIDFSVIKHGLQLDCRLNQKVQNDYLIVTPNGAVDRKKAELPAFARWNWHGIFNSNILAISDPTLHFDGDIPIGWFSGTKYQNVAAFTADVVVKVASLIGIPANRIIFWGSSAGGFASISLAAEIDGACFVSANGQTDILNYYAGHVEHFRRVFNSNFSAVDLAKKHPTKWSAISALQISYDAKKVTHGVIVQNVVDTKHYNEHYIPFCNHFHLPIEGGSNEELNLHSLLFSHEKGHGPEPAEIAKQVVEEYLPKILGENK